MASITSVATEMRPLSASRTSQETPAMSNMIPSDVESTTINDNDPYRLSTKVKSTADLSSLKNELRQRNQNQTALRSSFRSRLFAFRKDGGEGGARSVGGGQVPDTPGSPPPAFGNTDSAMISPVDIPEKYRKRKVDVKGVEKFYEDQNELIELLLKSVDEHREEAKQERGATRLKYLIAVQGSLIANILLSVLQVYAAVSSGSLSLFATMADSIFDPLSNILLIVSHRAVNKVDSNRYPSGKARLETAGNIIFCFLMCAVSCILIVVSIRDIAAHDGDEVKKFHLPSIIAVSVAFGTKFVLFLYCWSIKDMYSQVRILWEDHRNDLMICSLGILTSVGGSHLKWWLDPSGAILLSVIILGLWSKAAWGEFQLLIGVTADKPLIQQITYLAMTHSPEIHQIDTVRCYHSGPRLIVEVDVVMPPEISLMRSHDVAEELQIKLESLPGVERAYVHVDYETSHKPEHFLKKEL